MPVYARLKLLFADDSFQSYDFNKLYHSTTNEFTNDDGKDDDDDDDKSSASQQEEAIYLSEDLLIGSFICYVLVQSNLDLKLVGPDSNTFRLQAFFVVVEIYKQH